MGAIDHLNDVALSLEDMGRALEAVNALPPEHCNAHGRILRLLQVFETDDRPDQVNAVVRAIDARFHALTRLIDRPELRPWLIHGEGGRALLVASPILEAAAVEPLILVDGEPVFDPDSFVRRLLARVDHDGRA